MAVCFPSSIPEASRLEAGLQVLASRYHAEVLWPRRPEAGPPYLAGTDEERAAALLRGLAGPARALLAARGGYGALRLVERLPAEALWEHPKPLCGFSDTTVLLEIWQRAGLPCFHGPVVTQLPDLPKEDQGLLWRLLEDPRFLPTYEPEPGAERLSAPSGRRQGLLWGGNLASLASLVGVLPPPEPEPHRILLLEDIGEPPYRIDRMLTQLRAAGWLRSVRAAVLGSFSGPGEGLATAARRLQEFGIPAVGVYPWGHGRRNAAVPLGVPAELDLASGRLQVLARAPEGPCHPA